MRREDIDAALALCAASDEAWARDVAQTLTELFNEHTALLSASVRRGLNDEANRTGIGRTAIHRGAGAGNQLGHANGYE
jgi:hypothetical protein